MRRYIGIFFTLRGPVFSWDSPIFAYLTSFYIINDARHLWSNLQKCEFSFWEKEYDCNKCKTTFKKFFHDYGCFLMPFRHFWMNWCCAPSVIQYAKKNWMYILLETAPKTLNISKFTKEQEIFAKWTRDGVQHQFNKNWFDRQKMGFLWNT